MLKKQITKKKSFSQEVVQSSDNSLKEFGVDTDHQIYLILKMMNSNSDNLLGISNEEEDDDLEIPAFLRRQKN